MKALLDKKEKARALRKAGYSIKEIVKELDVAQSSISVWVRDVPLDKAATARILTRIKLGQFNSAENNKARTDAKRLVYLNDAKRRLAKVRWSPDASAFLCAALYWCEGLKSERSSVTFMNSDPDLIRLFISLLRNTFKLDESKFHPLLHVHQYHDIPAEIAFWSKITRIKPEQFMKPYLKPHTGKRVREGYHGCLSLRYYDVAVGRQLLALGKVLIGKI